MRLQEWGAPMRPKPLARVLETLPGLTCLWTPSPRQGDVESYQLAVVNPAVMRLLDESQTAALEGQQVVRGNRGIASAGRVSPVPTAEQVEAIVLRCGWMVTFPPPAPSLAATGDGRKMDRRLDNLNVKVSAFVGTGLGKQGAISWLAAEGYLHPDLLNRTACALGVDLGLGWLETALSRVSKQRAA